MRNLYQIYLISDSTGETLDRIFLALKAQFPNFEYETNHFSFTRTESQTLAILKQAKKDKNSIILYTIVNSKLAKYLTEKAYERNIPCFGVLGDLILNFSKVLNQKASHQPSGQHILNEEYYDRIEAIQFTMNHDDGNLTKEIKKSDIKSNQIKGLIYRQSPLAGDSPLPYCKVCSEIWKCGTCQHQFLGAP